MASQPQRLIGYRVLVVEDEYFLAFEIEDALTRQGAEVVGPIPSLNEALQQIHDDGFDLAVIDINLGGNLAFAVADALNARRVPFVFASAYAPGELPARLRGGRLVQKPYDPEALIASLVEVARREAPS